MLDKLSGRIALMLLLTFAMANARAAATEDAILGVWLTDGGDSKVEIVRSGSTYSGKVIWLKEPERNGQPLHDDKNADPALRARPLLGLEVLSGYRYAGDGTWKDGNVYAPRRGRSFPAELSIDRSGRLNLKVKEGIFSKTTRWTR